MSRREHSAGKCLGVAAALALCASGATVADDSSLSRFGGDSYAYFNSQPAVSGKVAGIAAWRRSHPNGLTQSELEAVSSSGLSGFAARLDPPAVASASADPTWRRSHPGGLTEHELQVLSSSPLSAWHAADRSTVVAESPGNETLAARVRKLIRE